MLKYNRLGIRIKILRNKKGLTQKKLSKLSKVSCATISFIESNVVCPNIYTIKKLAKSLNVDVEELIK